MAAASKQSLRIVLVEDDPDDAALFALALKDHHDLSFKLTPVSSLQSAVDLLSADIPDILVADLFLPDSRGLETVTKISRRFPDLPMVVLTGARDEKMGLASLKEGAQDFLVKGTFDETILPRTLLYSIERKRADVAVLARRAMEEEYQLQAGFIAMISHELRTPIAAVQGFAETLRRGAIEDGRNRMEFVVMIEKHARQLGELVEELLEIAALRGKRMLKREPIHLLQFVSHICDSLEPLAKQRKVQTRASIPSDMILLADRTSLTRIFENLIGNAIKYSREGEGIVKVTAQIRGNSVAIRVEDNGIGIPKEDLAHIFKTFHRSQRAKKAGIPGTGLGLAIVKAAVESHGGEISIKSEKNGETRVDFTLPLACPAKTSAAA